MPSSKYSRAQLLAALTAIKVAQLNGGDMKLFKNDVTPTPSTVVGDLTEATFPGYASFTVVTMGANFIDSAGRVCSNTGQHQFVCSGGGPLETIYGCYFVDTGGLLVMAARFDEPIEMLLDTDAILVDMQYTINPGVG